VRVGERAREREMGLPLCIFPLDDEIEIFSKIFKILKMMLLNEFPTARYGR
jgi:hypothetical protein